MLKKFQYYIVVFVVLEIVAMVVCSHAVNEKKNRYFSKQIEAFQVVYNAIVNTSRHLDPHQPGNVEFMSAFDGIQQQMEHLFLKDVILLVKHEFLGEHFETDKYVRSYLSKDYWRKKTKSLLNDISAKQYINPLQREQIDLNLQPQVEKQLSNEKAFAVSTTLANDDFVITFMPIFNVEKKLAAYIGSYAKDSTVREYMQGFYT